MEDKFESWAIVELFGHKKMAGKVSEQDIAGTGFIRIDVPAVNGSKAFTKFLGPSSIYGITPVDEEHATAAASAWNPIPVDNYDMQDIARRMADRISSRDRQIEYDDNCGSYAGDEGDLHF
jgi:hypothetical protein